MHKNLGFGHRACLTVRPEKALLGLRSHFALWVTPVVFCNKSAPKPMTWVSQQESVSAPRRQGILFTARRFWKIVE